MTQSDIINNNFSKAFECIKCSNAYDTGAVLSEEKLFKQLSERKRSTFDLSKFTIVGSPNITDDGVASGFSASNYLQRAINITPSNKLIIKSRIVYSTLGNSSSYPQAKVFWGTNYNGWRLLTNYGNTIQFASSNLGNVALNIGTLTDGDIIDTELIITQTNITINAIKNGIKYTKTESKTVTFGNITSIVLGDTFDASVYYFTGSIDLKQFSITVDEQEVFNGNKTGIDTITPDNYEVVGSPVISDDGIASGFSSSNYLTIPKLSSLVGSAGSWELDMQFTTPNDITSSRVGWLFEGNTHWCNLIRIGGDGTNYTGIQVSLTSTGSSYDIASYKQVVRVTANTTYWLKLIFTGTEYLCKYSTNGTDFTTVNIATSSLKISDKSTLLNIGVSKTAKSPFRGSIDLNAFKIYVDGNLVYQPCLKIPYTQSKTGSKIVDVVYRDRVIDLYEQEGQAGYYTIDEENKNFTLPMGEIYGMIGQRILISSTVTETNRVDIYSDKTCLICGNVATAGTINLPIELVNNNYFITLPTSAKTATSFTTTATGDFILIGKVI